MEQTTETMSQDQGTTITLPMGARREYNISETRIDQMSSPEIEKYNHLLLDSEKCEQSQDNVTWDDLARMFDIEKQQIFSEWVDDELVIFIPYSDSQHLQATLENNPGLEAYIYSTKPLMDIEPQSSTEKVKIRQCPIETDITKLLILNNLIGWKGKLLAPRAGSKRTTAILTAPSEEEARNLLEKGYIADCGKILGVLPGNSNLKDEDRRTILLVGVHKVFEAQKKAGSKLTELVLMKTLIQYGYPIQTVKFVELPGGKERIGHSAYVTVKRAEQIQTLQPIKDTLSGTLLKWTSVENRDKICHICLSWSDHDPSCPRHESNRHKYATSQETSRRAAERDAIFLESLKKRKEKPR